MEHLHSFKLLNQEFATFGEYEYEVFPAERKQEDLEGKWTEPYLKDDPKGKRAEHPNRAFVELPQHPVRQDPSTGNTKPPTILKRQVQIEESVPVLPNEDVEMRDATKEESITHKCKGTIEDEGLPKAKMRPKTKPSLEDVVIWSKTEQGGKRASPAYCFASELQEKVDTEVLYNSLIDKEVTVRLGNILGSSFKLSKRLQIAMKTQ
jgi:Protein of unknown function (DUF4100)